MKTLSEKLEKLRQMGLSTLIITNQDGLPLLTRHYDPNSPLRRDSLLISSFFTAIHKFAESLLISFISDIGIYSHRLFFKYHNNLIYILAFEEKRFNDYSFQMIRQAVEEIAHLLISKFFTYYQSIQHIYKSYELSHRLNMFNDEVDVPLIEGWESYQKTELLQPFVLSSIPEIDKISFNSSLQNHGVIAIYIYEVDTPIWHKIYDPKAETVDGDLLGSFYNGIQTFTRTTLLSQVTDIGFFTKRIFIKIIEPYTFLLVQDEIQYINVIKSEIQELIYQILDTLAHEFLGSYRKKPKETEIEDDISLLLDKFKS